MSDGCFLALLDDVVSLRRPRVDVSSEGNPRTPVYEAVCEAVPCAIQPVSDRARSTIVGTVELATHIVYLEPMDLRVSDLLVVEMEVSALSEGAVAGDEVIVVVDAGTVARGDRLEIGEGEESELALAAKVAGATVTLDASLASDHAEGDRVRSVAVYEVLGVRDEAGRGHHVRAEARLLTC